jgi:heme/copper-type cytochrome/quinol oxidase subunit 3
MSITDTTSQSGPHSEMHGGTPGHHEDPEVVDARQRLGIWLFIAADVIVVAALLFTYLYLRGTDTSGHWMSMSGYKGSLHTYEQFSNMADAGTLAAPSTIYTGVLSVGLQWVAALLTVVSAGIVWIAERGLRKTKNAKAFATTIVLAIIVALVGVVVSIVQLHDIPQVFVAVNDSMTMSYTAYDSSMLAIIVSAFFHLVVVAFLGLGLTIRAARGVINGDKWYQVRLVRLYWVWVAISAVVVTAITTGINTIH